MGKVFRTQKLKTLPSLQGADEFTFTYKTQKDQNQSDNQRNKAGTFSFTPFSRNSPADSGCQRPSKASQPNVPSRVPADPPDFLPAESDVDEPDDEPRPSSKGNRLGKKWPESAKWSRRNTQTSFRKDEEDDYESFPTQRNSRNKRKRLSEGDNDDGIDKIPVDFITAKQKLSQKMASASNRNRTEELNDSRSSRPDFFQTSSQDVGRSGIGRGRDGGGIQALTGGSLKTLPKRGVRSGFVPPMRNSNLEGGGCSKDLENNHGNGGSGTAMAGNSMGKEHNNEAAIRKCLEMLGLDPNGEVPERIRNLEPRLIEHITNEILSTETRITWADIAGLEHAKRCVREMIIWPLKRPDLFQGTRAPGKGLLLYGPPGTGKTLIGKAIAGESNATFFSISSSSLTSKWIGEGEKLVRALFGVASCVQPAVIFVDEIDSLLSQRKEDGEHESSRRLKTQFLIEMEGCSGDNDQVLVIGATNRPQELDPAVRRRMSNRLYIPLPELVARAQIIRTLLQKDNLLTLSDDDIEAVSVATEGYSGSDMKNLVKEASMGPLREAMMSGDIALLNKDDIRPVSVEDFHRAIRFVRPSVAPKELTIYEEWSTQFGSGELK